MFELKYVCIVIVFKSGHCQVIVKMLFRESKYSFFLAHFIQFLAKFLKGLCSNFKDAKIKDSLREILENIVSVCFNQVTE